MSEENKETKKSAENPIDKFSKSETVNVFMFVISSPVRIVGAVILGIFAMFFGIFVYPGNEKIQNVILKKFDDAPQVAQGAKKPDLETPKPVAATTSQSTSATPGPANVAPAAPAIATAPVAAPPVATPPVPTTPVTATPVAAPPAQLPGAPPTASQQSVEAALRSFWPNAADQYTKQVIDDYAKLKPTAILAASADDRTYWMTGTISNIPLGRNNTVERCFLISGKPCFVVAEGGVRALSIEKEAWKPHVTAALEYTGRFDVAMIPGLRRDLSTIMTIVDAYARAPSANRALVIDPRGIAFSALAEPSQKAAEAKAFAECEAKTEFKPKTCILYATGDSVVLGQRILAPRN